MAIFTEEQSRDIREYVFQLDEPHRYKILQCVRILTDEGEDEDSVVSVMYEMAKDKRQADRIFTVLTNNSIVGEDGLEEEITDKLTGG